LCIAKSVFEPGMKNLPWRVITGLYRLYFTGCAAVKRMLCQFCSLVIERNVHQTFFCECAVLTDWITGDAMERRITSNIRFRVEDQLAAVSDNSTMVLQGLK
jgi:hypothetical protein